MLFKFFSIMTVKVAAMAIVLVGGGAPAFAADAWSCKFSEGQSSNPTALQEVLPSYVHSCETVTDVEMREGLDYTAFLTCGSESSARIRLVRNDAPDVDAFGIGANGDKLTFSYPENGGETVIIAACSWGPSPLENFQ